MGLAHGSALSERVIGLAIEIHRHVGPGLLESVYEECMCFELRQAGIQFARQVSLPMIYKGFRLDCAYRIDLTIEDEVILEIKSVERLLAIHEAQVITYLRLSGRKVGLLMNFNTPKLKDGLRRFVL